MPSETTVNPYAKKSSAYYALGVLTLVYSFNFIDRQLLAILQESIKADLGLSDSQLGLLTGFAFAVFYVTAGIPIARWADRSNRRNIVALSLAVWSGMTAVSGMAQNYLQLLLARIGVGVGEAGGSPPSHSMISDIFPVHQRASALGFYSTGVNVGILFGFLLGGWLNEYFGWRIAFLVVGAPGILLALLVRFTVAEPIRGLSENKQVSDRPIPVTEVLALLWSRRSFRHLAVASGLTAFVAYSIISWGASYFIRSHGMSTGELGTWLALIMGLGGAIGAFGGGVIADRLGNRDKRWYVWVPAIAGMLATPFIVATYSVDSAYLALLCSVVPGVMGNVFLGSTVATVHGLVGVRMRAMSSAVFFFILNIIGLGLGPFSVGLLSDYLALDYGQESLRYAMLMILPGVGVLAVVHFMLASRNLREDLLNAPD
ncbi:MAG: MFS family permease [Halioglobus sp.]|jgi:MFS family permease